MSLGGAVRTNRVQKQRTSHCADSAQSVWQRPKKMAGALLRRLTCLEAKQARTLIGAGGVGLSERRHLYFTN